jgi:hypothetical protein
MQHLAENRKRSKNAEGSGELELLLVDLLECLQMDLWAQLPLDQQGLMAMDLGRVDLQAQSLLQELLQQVGSAVRCPTQKNLDG